MVGFMFMVHGISLVVKNIVQRNYIVFLPIIRALIDVNFKGYFTLECSSSLIKYDQWTGKRRNFDKSSKLREPQLFMQRHIEKMMYDTARWMLSEYEIFEN